VVCQNGSARCMPVRHCVTSVQAAHLSCVHSRDQRRSCAKFKVYKVQVSTATLAAVGIICGRSASLHSPLTLSKRYKAVKQEKFGKIARALAIFMLAAAV
jgi:hypothetical protein